MTRSALFSPDRTLRREIRRSWVQNPTRWAVWLMLNPSNAGVDRDDPTAQRVTNFSAAWGYDGWIGVNTKPYIASRPEDMWAWADWERTNDWAVRDALQANLRDIEAAARIASLRMVAFGNGADRDQPWLEQCLEAFGQPSNIGADERLYCLGVTNTGAPKHPLARGKYRVPVGTMPQEWSRQGAVVGGGR
jgi:hypothetical protein